MRAAVLREYGEPLALEDVDPPAPGPEDAVVELEACGICRSDWHAWRGHGEWADDRVPLGQVLGHEPVGRVVETGDRVDLPVGERVAVPFCLGEGECRYCSAGHGNVCPDGLALGFEPDAQGAFAERVRVPWADFNAIPLPEDLDPAGVAALGCRFMTAYQGLAHRVDLAPGEWVAVYGCGGVGLSAVIVADAVGARVCAVDVDEDTLDFAEWVGADATINADATADVPRTVRGVTDGGAGVSVDALGIEETCRNAVDSLRPTGQHLQLGLTTDAERGEIALPTDRMTMTDVTFHGSRGMPPSRGEELVELIESGDVDPSVLVSREVSLEELPERLAAMDDYDTRGVEVVTEF
jgi:alcohol dehydrogenase